MNQTLVNLIIIFFFISFKIYGQEQTLSPKAELEKYFTEAQNGKSYTIRKSTLESIDSKQFLKIAKPDLLSDNPKVRYSAIDILKRKGTSLSESSERSEYVRLLIEACRDKDSGNSGAASKALMRFQKSDFDTKSGESLLDMLKAKPYYYERVIQLVGFVQPPNSSNYLKEKLQSDSTLKQKTSWAVKLALARIGDKEALEYCMGKVKSAPINTQAVDYLFPDLLYTRQPEAIQYMLDEILSDEKKCGSSNPNSEAKIICAFRIMQLVAPAIKNFPLPLDKYGELEIDDYDAALLNVRDWINSKPVLEINNDYY